MGYHERAQRRYAGAHVLGTDRPSAAPPAAIPATVYVALGSNLGDRLALLRSATAALGQREGIRVQATSPVFETRPVGPSEGAFLNAAVAAMTTLTPHEVLDALLDIERQHGRVRTVRWAARTLDLDLLAYVVPPSSRSLLVADDRLTLPHPHLHERDFVLEPLCALAPSLTLGTATAATHLATLPASARTIERRWAQQLRTPATAAATADAGPVIDPATPRG